MTINWNKPVEWSTGEATSMHRELGGGSTRWVNACDDWRDLTGDAGVAVDVHTGKILGCEDENMPFVRNVGVRHPAPGGVYLHVFHGRNTVEEDMDDWGFDGPVIGPLRYVHTTYKSDVKFACAPEVARKFFTEQDVYTFEPGSDGLCEGQIFLRDDLLTIDGKFYGDWSVFGPEMVTIADDGALVAL